MKYKSSSCLFLEMAMQNNVVINLFVEKNLKSMNIFNKWHAIK